MLLIDKEKTGPYIPMKYTCLSTEQYHVTTTKYERMGKTALNAAKYNCLIKIYKENTYALICYLVELGINYIPYVLYIHIILT